MDIFVNNKYSSSSNPPISQPTSALQQKQCESKEYQQLYLKTCKCCGCTCHQMHTKFVVPIRLHCNCVQFCQLFTFEYWRDCFVLFSFRLHFPLSVSFAQVQIGAFVLILSLCAIRLEITRLSLILTHLLRVRSIFAPVTQFGK